MGERRDRHQMSGKVRIRWGVAAVYAAVSILLPSILLTLAGRHALPLLEERFLFQAPGFVQARILVHLAARGLALVLPSAGIITIYHVLSSLSVMAMLLSFRRLVGAVSTHTDWPDRDPARDCLIILVPVVANYILLGGVFMPEDFPAIALFSLGLAMLLEGRTGWFYAVFAVGCLNRETIVLLVPAFVLAAQTGRSGLGDLIARALHAVLLLAIWAGIRACIFTLLCGGIPVLYEDHLAENLAFVRDMILMKPHAAKMWLTFGGMWLLVPFAWRRMPAVLRRLMILFPIMFLIMLKTGNFDGEARIWNELVPLAALPWFGVRGKTSKTHRFRVIFRI